MRILIAQMTRMGDVLQTSPLVKGLRERHPDAHIALMVRGIGRGIAERMPQVDELILYDEDEMFLALRSQDSDKLLRAYEVADGYAQRLRDGRFDVAYNCTNSIASAMLLKLAGIPEVVGAHLSDDWQFILRGPWTNYFFTSIFHRQYNDMNLCDIFRSFQPDPPGDPALVFEVRDEDRAFADSLCREYGVGPDDFVACFQLGASEEHKRWPEAHFATLARELVRRRSARVFLVGVEAEAHLGAAFLEHAPGAATPLYGKTKVPQLAALLERADILVTNDTGTMHIAAAVGCPVALVSVGHVHFRETGPYAEGVCAIEKRRAFLGQSGRVPGGLAERDAVVPDQVMRGVEAVLARRDGGPLPLLEDSPKLREVGLFMTRFAPDGYLEWYPLLRRPMTETDFMRAVFRAMWLDHLGAQRDTETERESLRLLLERYMLPEGGELAAWEQKLPRCFDELTVLAGRGIAGTDQLLGTLRRGSGYDTARELARQLARLDEEIRIFGEVHPVTKPLVVISRYERENLEGMDPLVLAETTRRIYEDLAGRARLTGAKLRRVAGLARQDSR